MRNESVSDRSAPAGAETIAGAGQDRERHYLPDVGVASLAFGSFTPALALALPAVAVATVVVMLAPILTGGAVVENGVLATTAPKSLWEILAIAAAALLAFAVGTTAAAVAMLERVAGKRIGVRTAWVRALRRPRAIAVMVALPIVIVITQLLVALVTRWAVVLGILVTIALAITLLVCPAFLPRWIATVRGLRTKTRRGSSHSEGNLSDVPGMAVGSFTLPAIQVVAIAGGAAAVTLVLRWVTAGMQGDFVRMYIDLVLPVGVSLLAWLLLLALATHWTARQHPEICGRDEPTRHPWVLHVATPVAIAALVSAPALVPLSIPWAPTTFASVETPASVAPVDISLIGNDVVLATGSGDYAQHFACTTNVCESLDTRLLSAGPLPDGSAVLAMWSGENQTARLDGLKMPADFVPGSEPAPLTTLLELTVDGEYALRTDSMHFAIASATNGEATAFIGAVEIEELSGHEQDSRLLSMMLVAFCDNDACSEATVHSMPSLFGVTNHSNLSAQMTRSGDVILTASNSWNPEVYVFKATRSGGIEQNVMPTVRSSRAVAPEDADWDVSMRLSSDDKPVMLAYSSESRVPTLIRCHDDLCTAFDESDVSALETSLAKGMSFDMSSFVFDGGGRLLIPFARETAYGQEFGLLACADVTCQDSVETVFSDSWHTWLDNTYTAIILDDGGRPIIYFSASEGRSGGMIVRCKQVACGL